MRQESVNLLIQSDEDLETARGLIGMPSAFFSHQGAEKALKALYQEVKRRPISGSLGEAPAPANPEGSVLRTPLGARQANLAWERCGSTCWFIQVGTRVPDQSLPVRPVPISLRTFPDVGTHRSLETAATAA